MLWVGFEATIPVFERAKAFNALDRTATMIVGLKAAYRYFICAHYMLGDQNSLSTGGRLSLHHRVQTYSRTQWVPESSSEVTGQSEREDEHI
jgi:hypothetical protein